MTQPPPLAQPGRNSKDLAPRILTLGQLAKLEKPLEGPVALFFTKTEWDMLVDGVPVSKEPPALGTVGLIELPSPFGGILGFLSCYSGDADTACFPSTISWEGHLVYGSCYCIRGPREKPLPKETSCVFSLPVCFQAQPCSSRGLRCGFVRKPIFAVPPGPTSMLVCECRR